MVTKEHHAAWKRQYYKKNRQRILTIHQRWYRKHRALARARALDYYKENKEKIRAKCQREREAAWDHYGGRKCVCCGVTEPSFLTLGHTDGSGGKHRREILGNAKAGGYAFYLWLKRNNYPPLPLRVECWNCNLGRVRRTDGKCVHELSR